MSLRRNTKEYRDNKWKLTGTQMIKLQPAACERMSQIAWHAIKSDH